MTAPGNFEAHSGKIKLAGDMWRNRIFGSRKLPRYRLNALCGEDSKLTTTIYKHLGRPAIAGDGKGLLARMV